jgi:hypothetical protein
MRAGCRQYYASEPSGRIGCRLEMWLGCLSPEPGTLAIIYTLHMSPSRRLAKSTRPVPLEAPTSGELWPKLFSEASGYQTVLIGLQQRTRPIPMPD